MNHYTDEDVNEAVAALLGEIDSGVPDTSAICAVLDAVAPAIATRAQLAELAEVIRLLDDGADADAIRERFHDLRSPRADEIEAQP